MVDLVRVGVVEREGEGETDGVVVRLAAVRRGGTGAGCGEGSTMLSDSWLEAGERGTVGRSARGRDEVGGRGTPAGRLTGSTVLELVRVPELVLATLLDAE